ncbi:response regulator [Magnetovibrio blakemorei]|uniref:Response regulatory domain-containing protein n=1 Tax=Magnetovibrio blakemorei TaxID=28181 RepID=A0A1E5QBL0_9PROT|nr:response regulator [Magnetovibrio blakemorei]OEJ69411.1 hypothetical protein BEN30_03110 [Magnetovibrio blakemorei]
MAKILVIDDDQSILDFIQSCLEDEDEYEVVTALDGERGLVECERSSFDLILTDIFMPFRDGLDIIREVSKMYPKTKTIAMTSHYGVGHTDYLKAAEVIGADLNLRKPFSCADLMAAFEQLQIS